VRHGERACAVAKKDVDIAAGSDSEVRVAVAVEIAGGGGGSSGERSYGLSVKCPITVTQKHRATYRHVELAVIVEIRDQDTSAAERGSISSVIGEGAVSIPQ